MATIIATHRGRSVAVQVDAERFAELGRYRWHIQKDGYAARNTRVDGRSRTVLMHRVVAGCEYGDGREVDHRSRDKLDNRRNNLRIVTRVSQMQNVGANRDTSSRFRGVSWRKDCKRWVAYAQVAGRRVHLGFFSSEAAAAAAAEKHRADCGYASAA